MSGAQVAGSGGERVARRAATACPRRPSTPSSARRGLPLGGRRRPPPAIAGRRPLAHRLRPAHVDPARGWRGRGLLRPRGRGLSTGSRSARRRPSPAVDTARVPPRRSVLPLGRAEIGHRVAAQGKPLSSSLPVHSFRFEFKIVYELHRERKCADTIGTVLVPWAGHFR